MKLSDLSPGQLAASLSDKGIGLGIGPFAVCLRSRIASVADSVSRLYADYPLLQDEEFFDFHVAVQRSPGLRAFFQPQAQFLADGEAPFKPLPLNQAYPFFEWGLNWCIAQYAHQYLILHAAVVEKNGVAAIFPGNPGAGKSTLCASLVASGWRLLSDEMAILGGEDERLLPIPRPVALKNDAIDLIKAFAPKMVFGESFHDTAKGTVAHMRPPEDSVLRAQESAVPRLLLFPRYEADSEPSLESLSKAQAFLEAVKYAFNYDFLGSEGFRRLRRLIDACECYRFSYPSIDASLETLEKLWKAADRGEHHGVGS